MRMTSKKALVKITDALRINPAKVERKLVKFIKKKVHEAGADGVVVGLSGGIDSSVVTILCAKALGEKKVIAVTMPESDVTKSHDVADARDLAYKLGIEFRVVDISPIALYIRKALPDFQVGATLPNANIRPRIRMLILYYYANLFNRLVVGGGNRSELKSGYFTKYGDGAADLLPIGSLYKTQVKQLAAHLGLPKQMIDKVPTAGLWKGQTDEDELGIPYEKLDMIYAGHDIGLRPKTIAAVVGVPTDMVNSFIDREGKMAHKLKSPYTPKP